MAFWMAAALRCYIAEQQNHQPTCDSGFQLLDPVGRDASSRWIRSVYSTDHFLCAIPLARQSTALSLDSPVEQRRRRIRRLKKEEFNNFGTIPAHHRPFDRRRRIERAAGGMPCEERRRCPGAVWILSRDAHIVFALAFLGCIIRMAVANEIQLAGRSGR